MNPEVVIEFEGGYLQPLKPENAHLDYISGLNDPEVNRYLVGVKLNTQTEQTIVNFIKSNQQSQDALLFGIWLKGKVQHCGTIRLHGIEYHHQSAHIGVCIFDKSTWGKHLGSKAIKAVTQWAFLFLNLRWVEAGAYVDNIASQKTFLAAGYEWIYDVPYKYIFEDKETVVKVYAARNTKC